MNHHVRPGEVEARTTRFQGNAEHRRSVPVEFLHELHSLFFRRGTREAVVTDSRLLHAFLKNPKHRGELGKEKNLVATVHRVVQKLHAELHFGRALLVILINESRIAAKLAKTGELGQHLHSDIGKLFVFQHEF